MSPSSISIRNGPSGKPAIRGHGSEFHFNVTHTDDIALIAVAKVDVGIDIERKKRSIRNVTAILQRRLSNTEQALVLQNARAFESKTDANYNEILHSQFIQMWVRKEAHAKCIGTGIAQGFATFQIVQDWDGLRAQNLRSASIEPRWPITDLDVDDNYFAAVGTMSPNRLDLVKKLYQ